MTTLAIADRDLAPAPDASRERSRSLGWVIAVSLLLPAAFLARPFTDGAPRFHELQIDGAFVRVSPEAVRAALEPTLVTSFWGVDLVQARAALERLPWVAHARVERAWPATLRVRVWERSAFARWGDKGLLDTEANAFAPPLSDLDPTLPRLDGVPGQEREVLDTYQRLQQRLAGTAFELTGLKEDARGEWFARCVAGIDLHLGQGAPDVHLDLLTGPVLAALRQRMADVDYVDLRYTNGFAVNWRPPAVEGETHG